MVAEDESKMKIGEKLFSGSIASLLLGVLLASPLLYTYVAIGDSPEPLFGVEVTYAYIEKITGTYVPYGGFLRRSYRMLIFFGSLRALLQKSSIAIHM